MHPLHTNLEKMASQMTTRMITRKHTITFGIFVTPKPNDNPQVPHTSISNFGIYVTPKPRERVKLFTDCCAILSQS